MEVGAELCPYCLHPMTEEKPIHTRLTGTQWPIYKAIVDAGPEGISIHEIMEKFLPGKKTATLRTFIYAINRLVSPQLLKGRGGRYYLERLEYE